MNKTQLHRHQRKQARRKHRQMRRGSAYRHWMRRRAGSANSAPQLRNRPTPPKGFRPGVMESMLLEGRW